MRLFIAVNFEETMRNILWQDIANLKKITECGTFTRQENLHLTLAFLGEVQDNKIDKIKEAMEEAAGFASYLSLESYGKFRAKDGKFLYYRKVKCGRNLIKLREQIVYSLKKREISVDEKPFQPHITLVRRTKLKVDLKIEAIDKKEQKPTMQVTSFCLMKSERIDEKMVYSKLYEVKLNRLEQGQVKAVIFDMDGVLIDTEKYLVKYWCQAAREAGFSMKREHALLIRSLAGKYAEPRLKEIFGEQFNYEAIRKRRKELMKEQLQKYGIEKKAGVEEILSFLKKRGIKTAVATATDWERAEQYLKEIGIFSFFDKIICATMVENGKPSPDIYQYACKQIEEQPENCIAIEDSPNGIMSAYQAGCKVIMVPDLTEPDEKIEKFLTAVVGDLKELAFLF